MSQVPNTASFGFDSSRRPPRRVGWWLPAVMVVGILLVLVALLLPLVRTAGPAVRRAECVNNLREIGLALHNYVDAYGALPPAHTVDADGNPLHSWRTLILPILGQSKLYEKIDLSKPWNDEANAEAYKTVVNVFQCPASSAPQGHTTYMAVVAPNGCFRLTEPRRFSEITDGPSNTLMVIEVAPEHAAHWMAPVDADEALALGVGTKSELAHPGRNALFCDGSVKFLSTAVSESTLRALFSIDGNDAPAWDSVR